jgi:uncharacterized membrane protein YeiB
MRNVSDGKIVEKIKTFVLFSVTLFLKNRAIDEIWKNILEPGRSRMTEYSMRIACCILMLQTHTFGICNNFCSYTLTMVA